MKIVKVNVTKIDKARLFEGKSGKYLDLVLIDKPDDYGNDGFVCQSCSKEERERGVKMPIIGSWRRLGTKKPEIRTTTKQKQQDLPASQQPEEDDVPF